MDNVYQEMLQLIRVEGAYFNSNELEIGTIQSRTPLKVLYKDIVFDTEELRVSEALIERIISVTLLDENENDITVRDADNRVIVNLNVVKKLKIPSTLSAGDKVIVYLHGNVLWVLCKVV